jgi:arylsulfatase A-like enzyme
VLEHRNPSVIERMALRELRRCVVDGGWKLMLTGDRPTALFDLAADPAETRSLLTSQPERAAALHRLISPAQADDQSRASAEQDAAVLEHLRVLGYVD